MSSATLDRSFRARGEPNPVWVGNLILIIISHKSSQGLPPFLQCYPHNTHKHTHKPPPCCPTDLTSLRRFKGDYSTFITSSEVSLLTMAWPHSPLLRTVLTPAQGQPSATQYTQTSHLRNNTLQMCTDA